MDWDAIFRRIVLNSTVVESGCWIWTRRLHRGYAYMSMRIPGREHPVQMRVGRLAWGWRHKRRMPRHLDADHNCTVEACVNPDHIDGRSKNNNQRLKYTRMMPADRERLRWILCKNLGVTPR